jgi:proton glutamate symport protein
VAVKVSSYAAASSRESLRSSQPARVSIGLVLGLALGIAISVSASPTLRLVAGVFEPIGTIWVNAIRMTVIPLVFSLLVTAIAEERDIGAVGRLGTRALVIFTIMLTGVAVLGFLSGPPLFSLLTVDSASATTLRASAAPGAANVQVPTFASWLTSLVPTNPITAAADGAMLPLIVFAVIFAAALTRTPPDLRVAATSFFVESRTRCW